MSQFIAKTLISALIIAAASEIAKRSSLLAAILVSLPLTSILALTWLWMDTGDRSDVSSLATDILLLIAPSCVFFIALPLMLRTGMSFWLAMLLSCAAMALAYAAWSRLTAGLGWT